MLERIGSDIWGYVSDYHLGALAIPHRMTIVRVSSGGLVVHSPAKPDAQVRAQLASLGEVEAILWPSWWHDLYLREWAAAYPAARLLVAPALRRARRSIARIEILGETAPAWTEIEGLYVDGLWVNFDEFVFFHRPSRSLIVADLAVNVSRDVPFPTSVPFTLMGSYPGPRIPRCYRLVMKDKRYLREKLDRALAWDFDCIVMGHGDVVRSGGKAAFRQSAADLTGLPPAAG